MSHAQPAAYAAARLKRVEELKHALSQHLRLSVRKLVPVSGGDINAAFRAELADGTRRFVKTRPSAPPGMYACEAAGLAWLAQTRALRTPEVCAVSDNFLVLEWIEQGRRSTRFEQTLGRGLALLHQRGAPEFGLSQDNFLGPLRQPNGTRGDWPTFYAEQRLRPLFLRAKTQGGLCDAALERGFERLFDALPDLTGPSEPPSRLHGDLWSGNVMRDEAGAPVLIDPAVYGGHREVDLAMLQLFGAPSADFFVAYDAVYPRANGHAQRVALYQLYPLLFHLCMFGAGYRSQLTEALQSALRSA